MTAARVLGRRVEVEGVPRRAGPLLFIALIGLLFFSDLVTRPDHVLYSDCSDFLTLHLPAKRFLVRSWQQTGEVPLWCPYQFAGMPFVHDVQSTAFYPPHFVLYLLPERYVGAALSWLVVLHVLIAGAAMLAYARSRGLHGSAALVAAVGYMLAGKWLLHVLAGGHYNMVPLAWLPLVLLWLERAIRRGSVLDATWAGGAYALIVLGAYPYITLYAGLFIALWTLGTALAEGGVLDEGGNAPSRRLGTAVIRWMALGAWTLVVAVGLGAVQLLPSLEAAREASRSLGVTASGAAVAGGLQSIVGLVGPPLTMNPDALWENRVATGVLWLASAVLGIALGGKRARYQAGVCGVLMLFAILGGVLLQGLPGFRLFQLPSRILLFLALPIALLSGQATQTLFLDDPDRAVDIGPYRRIFLKTCVATLALVGLYAITLRTKGEELRFHPYWLSVAMTLPLAWWILHPKSGLTGRRAALLWLALLLADAWALARPLVAVKSEEEIYRPSACVDFLANNRGDGGRVMDVEPPGYSANATPLWPGISTVCEVEQLRGFNPVDVLRYKRYLEFLTGRDEPLRPLDRMFTSAVLGTFPLRDQALTDLLGVRYLLQPADVPLAATVPDPAARAAWVQVESDPQPRTFNFIPSAATGADAGLQRLPPYVVYENRQALPRAFVVPEARPLTEGSELLSTLQHTDFRKTVLLTGYEPLIQQETRQSFEPVPVLEYQPNRIEIDLTGTQGGYLVLTDVWFPGWTCAIDGQATRLYRGDYLFRAAAVPPGARRAVFRFAPASYRYGRTVSLASLIMLLTCIGCAGAVGMRGQSLRDG